jgi:hypothetical protein
MRLVVAASIKTGGQNMKLFVAAIATAAMIGTALPAFAEEVGVGVGVGPVGAGVTVGEGRRDRDVDVVRERDVVRDRAPRDHDTVIINKGDHDRDMDHDRSKVIIDHN